MLLHTVPVKCKPTEQSWHDRKDKKNELDRIVQYSTRVQQIRSTVRPHHRASVSFRVLSSLLQFVFVRIVRYSFNVVTNGTTLCGCTKSTKMYVACTLL